MTSLGSFCIYTDLTVTSPGSFGVYSVLIVMSSHYWVFLYLYTPNR